MKFEEWLQITKGKSFEDYFNDYPYGIANFENHLVSLKMSFYTYCKDNGLKADFSR